MPCLGLHDFGTPVACLVKGIHNRIFVAFNNNCYKRSNFLILQAPSWLLLERDIAL